MKLALAVHYDGAGASVAAVAFDDWGAAEATRVYTSRIAQLEKAAGQRADLRALSCLMQLIREHALEPEVIVIDGFVHADPAQEATGLGQQLHHALGGRAAVIGVSKKAMPGLASQYEVTREEESPPLIVTSIGIDLGAAKARLRGMHGRRRVPTLLKLVARTAKAMVAGAADD